MNRYDDIIHLPHYEPKYHERMAMEDRAAQFAGFGALTEYDEAIERIEATAKTGDLATEPDPLPYPAKKR